MSQHYTAVLLVLLRCNFVVPFLENSNTDTSSENSHDISASELSSAIHHHPTLDGSITYGNESCQLETLSTVTCNNLYSTDQFVSNNGDVLKLKVKFQGASDGHVLLTSTLSTYGLHYLIVIGGYGNKISEIRKQSSSKGKGPATTVFSQKTPEILTPHDVREFLILYKTTNGDLMVFPENSHMPLLHWTDPQPLQIQYFGFHSYIQKIVLAEFNCKPTGEFSVIPSFFPQPPEPSTRGLLMSDYDKQTLPSVESETTESNSSAVTVNLVSLKITHFKLDNGILELNCRMELTWRDDRLSGQNNETENNETRQSNLNSSEKVHFSHEQIWTPDIHALNRGPYSLSVSNPDQFPLYYKNELVHWKLSASFIVPCAMDLRRWPKDNQKCAVQIGSWKYSPSELTFHLGSLVDGEVSDLKLQWTKDMGKLELRMLSVKVDLIGIGEESDLTEEEDEDANESSVISVRIGFQRRSSIYSYTVSLPIILISILNLGMFLVPLDIYERSVVSAISFLVLSIYLMFFRFKLPDLDHIPYIVILYGWNVILSTLNILSQAFLPRLGELVGSKSPPQCLSHIYNPSLMTVLGLGHLGAPKTSTSSPPTVAVVRSLYKRNSNRSSDESELPRPTTEEPPMRFLSSWGLLAASINRISFVAYTTITLVLLACLI